MADTYKTIKCPACGNTMKKIFIPSAGVSIDICNNGCGGIFFDNQELNKFSDKSVNNTNEIKKELENKNFMPVNKELVRICPACGAQMVKSTYEGIKGLEVDSCYGCGAVFLDYGELDIIRKYYQAPKSKPLNKPQTNNYNGGFDLQQFYRETQLEQIEAERQERAMYSVCSGTGYLLNMLFRSLFRL